MDNWDLGRLTVGLVAILIVVVVFLTKTVFKGKPISTKFISRTGIFTAFAIILYVMPGLQFKLPIFPAFLEIHLDEIPLLICGFAYGPLSAFFGIALRTIVKLPMTSSLGVGELADFLYSIAFIIPAALIYKKNRTYKGAFISLFVGLITQTLFASLFTTFVILDFYMVVMRLPKAAILGMIQKAGIYIDSLEWPFFYSVGIPFNLLKDSMVVVVTLLMYKRIRILMEKVIK